MLIDLGGSGDFSLGLGLEEVTNTGGETTTDFGSLGSLLFLFLLLLFFLLLFLLEGLSASETFQEGLD